MKLTICFFILISLGVLGSVKTLPVFPEESDNTIWPIPQKDGTFIWMTEREAMEESMKSGSIEREAPPGKVRYFLYTQSNPKFPMELDMDDPETLVRSFFNAKNPTSFMIHGWASKYDAGEILGGDNTSIRKALFLNGDERELNFISVDWSVWGNDNYAMAKNHCSKAGKSVAEFIDWMHINANLSFDTLSVYGHSLGAHIAGFAGKQVKEGKINTIIGMDPAMPLFRFKHSENRLASTDAKYVETIQTNGGKMGFFQPLGQVAFYPNGGKMQPGCEYDKLGSCSHGRSVDYFSEALRFPKRNGFDAIKCKDFDNLLNATCNLNGRGVRLGDPNNAQKRNAYGIYYLETKSESPYALGKIL